MTLTTVTTHEFQGLQEQFDKFLNSSDEYLDAIYFAVMGSDANINDYRLVVTPSYSVLLEPDDYVITNEPTVIMSILKPSEIEYVNSRYEETKRHIRRRFNRILNNWKTVIK